MGLIASRKARRQAKAEARAEADAKAEAERKATRLARIAEAAQEALKNGLDAVDLSDAVPWLRVVSVEEDGPAAAAGLCVGDEVVRAGPVWVTTRGNSPGSAAPCHDALEYPHHYRAARRSLNMHIVRMRRGEFLPLVVQRAGCDARTVALLYPRPGAKVNVGFRVEHIPNATSLEREGDPDGKSLTWHATGDNIELNLVQQRARSEGERENGQYVVGDKVEVRFLRAGEWRTYRRRSYTGEILTTKPWPRQPGTTYYEIKIDADGLWVDM